MDGRAFLDLAREVVLGGTEVHWRATAIHAYYALILECRDVLIRWGSTVPPRQGVHGAVRLKFLYARDSDLKQIGDALERLSQVRNRANYNLAAVVDFSTDTQAQLALQRATDALALLDAIEADLARRATAIASLPP